ncbi:unnamed protein product [Aspergillus oryzae var. brunneus]|uniref:Unnamed protein product n=1 Tax=Aspergillus oryzae var. brunneus TaxID=332754 RepID=A0ABQ6KNT2_ASPOZ|nr:unnamed protein product [Aspergillus oryzae]GMG46957.1 unnamed protein product [Aspergillus oryzae var. brunneus]
MIHSARSRPQPNISSLLFSPGGQYSGVVSDDTSQSAVNTDGLSLITYLEARAIPEDSPANSKWHVWSRLTAVDTS